VKPAVNECKTVASSLSDGVSKILKASSGLETQNTRLMNENEKSSWWLLGLWVVVLLLVGVALGMQLSQWQMEARLTNLEAQMERLIEITAKAMPSTSVVKPRSGQ
jgi:uncharacterized protein YneF (UPF0154 family)